MRKESARWAWCRWLWFVLLAAACSPAEPRADAAATAQAFLEAFYSWERERLAALLAPGPDADNVLYYQGWAEAAHYRVQRQRPCESLDPHRVSCAVTVTDDFGQALGYTATDTFTLTVRDGTITGVSFVGDDPPVFEALFQWLSEDRPEVFAGPCKDMFAGGTTPGECAREIAQGARDFVALGGS